MKKLLVSNWKTLHKSFTVILSVIASIIGLIEVVLPHLGMLQPFLDPTTYGILMFGLTVSIAIGRYINQDSVVKGDTTKEKVDD
jgi:hypothetical protein